ncbi:hypothetical protein WJX74_000957 [Apatococcus lobatus]|uniref:Lipoyl-binding domain-containing protein n=2 Tax=Apatococcus TaxID=904362 RepID=A0AAW1SVV5_9CHLO
MESLNVQVPSMGDSITEGTIASVLKQQGESVAEDETILQIETDKVTIDVRAPKAGKLEAVLVSADDNVSVGQHVATVAAGEEGTASDSGGGDRSEPQEELGAHQDQQLEGGMSQPDSPHPGPQGGGVKQQRRQEGVEREQSQGAGGEGRSKPQAELGAQQDQQLQGGMSQPDSPHPGPQGGGAKQQKRQEGVEKEEARDESSEKAATSGSGPGPSHRRPSIKFPVRRTSDGRRLSSLPFEEAEQYRMQAQGSKPSGQQQPQQQQQQPAESSTPKPPANKPDAAAEQRHMLWYQGKERGSKLSQSSVLSQREMDMIELGGAF